MLLGDALPFIVLFRLSMAAAATLMDHGEDWLLVVFHELLICVLLAVRPPCWSELESTIFCKRRVVFGTVHTRPYRPVLGSSAGEMRHALSLQQRSHKTTSPWSASYAVLSLCISATAVLLLLRAPLATLETRPDDASSGWLPSQ